MYNILYGYYNNNKHFCKPEMFSNKTLRNCIDEYYNYNDNYTASIHSDKKLRNNKYILTLFVNNIIDNESGCVDNAPQYKPVTLLMCGIVTEENWILLSNYDQ